MTTPTTTTTNPHLKERIFARTKGKRPEYSETAYCRHCEEVRSKDLKRCPVCRRQISHKPRIKGPNKVKPEHKRI